MTDEAELTDAERRALEALPAMAPPAGFADRVLAARAHPVRRRRWPVLAGVLACAAAAAIALVVARSPSRAATGALASTQRTTAALGDRAVAVAEPGATLRWTIADDGAAQIEQRAGDVFYRVDRGGPFVVHTPAGDVRVTGTCFRIEVTPMTKRTHLLLAGAAGAALATAVVITVYEGQVIAETRTARAELAPGTRTTLGLEGRTNIAIATRPASSAESPDAPADLARATREELIARAAAQDKELVTLRDRLLAAESEHGDAGRGGSASPGAGRPWFDPDPETLAKWAAECHIRTDEPGLDQFKPIGPDKQRELTAADVEGYNLAVSELSAQWRTLVRALYLEATGDVAGADTLSVEAMRREVLEKGAPDEFALLLQRISQERAGLAIPPTDLTRTSPLERLVRATLQLGDQTEAALAKKFGAERARTMRGDGWGMRSDFSGCPDKH